MSHIFNLSMHDLIKGMIVAACVGVLTAFGTIVNTMLQTHSFSFTLNDLYFVLATSINGAIGYLLKQFLTDKDGKVLGKV